MPLHAGLCPQRRPRTWNREAPVGVRRTAADEEEADAHHRGLRGTSISCFERPTRRHCIRSVACDGTVTNIYMPHRTQVRKEGGINKLRRSRRRCLCWNTVYPKPCVALSQTRLGHDGRAAATRRTCSTEAGAHGNGGCRQLTSHTCGRPETGMPTEVSFLALSLTSWVRLGVRCS